MPGLPAKCGIACQAAAWGWALEPYQQYEMIESGWCNLKCRGGALLPEEVWHPRDGWPPCRQRRNGAPPPRHARAKSAQRSCAAVWGRLIAGAVAPRRTAQPLVCVRGRTLTAWLVGTGPNQLFASPAQLILGVHRRGRRSGRGAVPVPCIPGTALPQVEGAHVVFSEGSSALGENA